MVTTGRWTVKVLSENLPAKIGESLEDHRSESWDLKHGPSEYEEGSMEKVSIGKLFVFQVVKKVTLIAWNANVPLPNWHQLATCPSPDPN
jgi:hypothetical protein